MDRCTKVRLGAVSRGIETAVIENDLLSATVFINKGATIYELRYKPMNIDVLWKAPWGIRPPGYSLPTASSSVYWLEKHDGGWPILFPSGGGPSFYKGVELPFHGEASLAPWDATILNSGSGLAEIKLETRLIRGAFRMERTLKLATGDAHLSIWDRISNEGGEDLDYMWGQHPTLGAPFLSQACYIDVGSKLLVADDSYVGSNNPLAVGQAYSWPHVRSAKGLIDLSQVPSSTTPRDLLAYFEEFESGWFAVTNPELGFGFGINWPHEVFPYAWLWQELRSSRGYPWYGSTYAMAIEPNTSIPGQGLAAVMEKTQTHRTLKPGQSAEVELTAVFYESKTRVARIDRSGAVLFQ